MASLPSPSSWRASRLKPPRHRRDDTATCLGVAQILGAICENPRRPGPPCNRQPGDDGVGGASAAAASFSIAREIKRFLPMARHYAQMDEPNEVARLVLDANRCTSCRKDS